MEKFLSYFKDYDTILWDWNGTLLNDAHIAHEIVIQQRKEHKLPFWSHSEIRDNFCFPVKKFYEKMGFDKSEESFKELNTQFVEIYESKLLEIDLFPHTKKILESLSHKKHYVVSAAEERHLRDLISSHGIDHHFEEIYGLKAHGGCKKSRCAELILNHQIKPEKTLLVGDTTHDAEVGKSCGLNVLLIADGFQGHSQLKEHGFPVLKSRFSFLPS